MSSENIVLLFSEFSGNEKKILGELSGKPGKWIYFGKNYINFKKIESALGDSLKAIEFSKELNDISDSLRDDYQNYINKTNRLNKDSFEWWFTPLSSRNIYISEVFQNICYLQLLKDLYEKNQENIVLIVVESYSLGRIIEKWAEENRIALKPVLRPYQGIAKVLVNSTLSLGKIVFKAGLNYSFAKILALKYGEKKIDSAFLNKRKTALIDLFVYESNFGEDGSFSDRFFPGLEEYLINNGFNVIYHPTLAETKLNKYGLYKKMRRNNRYFIIAEDFLHVSDYLISLIIAVKSVRFSGEIPIFKEYDLSFADKCENKWNYFDGIFKSILIYRLFLRLGSDIGNDVERVIAWHENQLQDKALCLAVHKSFKGTKIIGVQHFIHYSNYLSLYPLDSESESLLLPDTILTTGTFESEKLRKYLNAVPVYESAALRYSHLYNSRERRTIDEKEILVLLPYDKKDAYEILVKVADIIPFIDMSAKIIVKCHPDYNEDIFESILKNRNISEKIIFSDKNIGLLLHSAAVVISSASGSLIEAVVSGIPTILIGKSNSLSLNPMGSVSCSFMKISYESGELLKSLNMFLHLTEFEKNKFADIGNSMRSNFFTAVYDDKMKVFIE
ncbi:MAG: hypothetical protein PHV39_01830 [Methanomicrobium sp.]|nr:hypothetical protein [Methanomicrobium sp.]